MSLRTIPNPPFTFPPVEEEVVPTHDGDDGSDGDEDDTVMIDGEDLRLIHLQMKTCGHRQLRGLGEYHQLLPLVLQPGNQLPLSQ